MLIASKSKIDLQTLKARLSTKFEMKELGDARRILGMDIRRDRKKGTLFLTQENYIKKVLQRSRMHETKEVSTPIGQHFKLSTSQSPTDVSEIDTMKNKPYANGVGSIMYSMACNRPYLSYAMSVESRFMANPGEPHWEALKWTMRYLKGSPNLGLMFRKQDKMEQPVVGFVDSDYAGNLDTRKPLTGFIFTLYGTAISWKSHLQSALALSTTEAECISLTEGIKEAIWLKGILGESGVSQDKISVHCDNQGAIHLTKHHVFHERCKHIDIKLHFVRDVAEKEEIKVEKISTLDNQADMMTKSLPQAKFKHCLNLVNVMESA